MVLGAIAARAAGVGVLALTGDPGEPLGGLADVWVKVPARTWPASKNSTWPSTTRCARRSRRSSSGDSSSGSPPGWSWSVLTVLAALVVVAGAGFWAFQRKRYGSVSPVCAFYRFVALFPSGLGDHITPPTFGILQRLIVGEIARTRSASKARVVNVPHHFGVALSGRDWGHGQREPRVLPLRHGGCGRGARGEAGLGDRGASGAVLGGTSRRPDRPSRCGSDGERGERWSQTRRTISSRSTVPPVGAPPAVGHRRREGLGHGTEGFEHAGSEVDVGAPILVLEPLEPDAPTVSMPPHMRKLLIGRDHNADVVIDHGEISRQCEIERVDDVFVVRVLGSTNGTRVNGAVVTSGSTLAPGDVLELARSVSYRRR